jgi:hypothetical protein
MLFAITGTIHSHLTLEQRHAAYARRAEWQVPEGMKVVGEWWQSAAPHILVIAEADSAEPFQALKLAWSDFMEITVSPAQTAEEGLVSGAKLAAAAR